MRKAICQVLISALLLTGALWPQNRSTAEIIGTVTDPSGAVVPNAAVKVANTKTGTRTQVTTNNSGVFDVPLLDPGSYTVEFQHDSQYRRFSARHKLQRTADRRLADSGARSIISCSPGAGHLQRTE